MSVRLKPGDNKMGRPERVKGEGRNVLRLPVGH